MKLVKVSGALVAGFLLMAVASSAWADIPTSDNFDDGVKSPAWGDDMLVGDGLNAVLSETNGHLEFAGSSSEIEDIVILRPWVAGMGSYTQNWEVATDVNVGALNLPQYVGIEMFLVVASADNETLGDRLVITLCLEEMERGFEVVPAVNNTELFAVPNYGYNSTAETNGRLRVAFDASTKILTASYDAIPLGLLDVDDALTDWGMDASSGFSFALGGSMWGDYTNSSSEVSADNFEFRSGDDLEYVLAINSGTGGGNYTNNAEVIIAASAAPSGQIFDHWVGSTQYLASVTAATTTVTMPAQAITLTATYTLRGTASGDDFDDNSKDMARWGDDIHFSTTNIFLNEINGRLEVLKSAGLDASGVFRPWVESTGSYTQDWETEADVHLSGISLDSGTSVNVNLAVANQDDATFGDTLSIALDLHNDDDDTYRGYEMNSKVNGSDLAAVPNYGYVATGDTDGRVKIAFDADSKILTASFNGNVLGWIDVDDPASNWEMTTNSLFAVAIAGSVHGASVGLASGDLYADNFSITFPSVPEFLYTTNAGQITITAYIGSGGAVDVPDTLDGLPVVAIGDGAFSSCSNVTSVAIATNVTSVGNLVFSDCTALKAVCFDGDSPVFGASIFSGTSGVSVYHLAGTSGWAETLDGAEVKTVYPVAEQGLAMSAAFDGTNWLIGIENHNAEPTTLEAQLLSADGTKIDTPILTGRTGMSTALAFDGTNYLMVWEDDGLGTLTNGSYQIYGQFISPSGTTNGEPFAISSTGIWYDGIRVMAYGGGKYLVTYTRLINPALGEDSTNRYIAGRLVDPSGSVGAEFRISTGYGQESDVAFDGRNFFVVWCEDFNDEEIRGRFVSPSGVPGTEISVNASAVPSDNPKSVVFDGQNYLVVWNDETGGYESEIWGAFGQLVSTNGLLVGDVITIVDDPGAQMVTSLAFDGFNYLAVWSDMQTDGDWDMYGQHISASGALVGSRFPLMACGDNQIGGVGFANGKYIVLINDDVIMSDDGVDEVDGSYVMFITPAADSDGDELPDTWEQDYFGSAGASPANLCSNGVNTVLEAYIAGIDPNDPQSEFLTSILPDRILQWNAVSGRVCSVYWTTNLLSGFQCLESNIPWSQCSFTNQVADPRGYYKVEIRMEE